MLGLCWVSWAGEQVLPWTPWHHLVKQEYYASWFSSLTSFTSHFSVQMYLRSTGKHPAFWVSTQKEKESHWYMEISDTCSCIGTHTDWSIIQQSPSRAGNFSVLEKRERKKKNGRMVERNKEKQKRKERNERKKKGRTEMPKREKILWNVRTCAVVPSRAMWSTADDPWVSFQVAFQWQDPIF